MSQPSILDIIAAVNACLQDDTDKNPRTQCFTNNNISLNYYLAIVMSIVCFMASVITNNDSWVDRFWSVIPVVCAWIHTFIPKNGVFVMPEIVSTQLIFTIIITLWGIRLTYNFYRKGGYKRGGEDYRWNYVRTWPIVSHPAVWPFFSLLIISSFQVFLLVAIALPVAQLPADRAPTALDWFFIVGQVYWLVIEAAADQQQWNFHQYKQGKRRPVPLQLQADCERGFLTHGLFSFSRHPNVLCEQLFWVNLFFASSCYAGFNLSAIGAISLVLLTNFSSLITEALSSRKYPLYAVYQKVTPFLYPSPMSTRAAIDRKMAAAVTKKQ